MGTTKWTDGVGFILWSTVVDNNPDDMTIALEESNEFDPTTKAHVACLNIGVER